MPIYYDWLILCRIIIIYGQNSDSRLRVRCIGRKAPNPPLQGGVARPDILVC